MSRQKFSQKPASLQGARCDTIGAACALASMALTLLPVTGARAQTVATQSYTAATTGTTFIVPSGVTSIQIELWGGGGAGGSASGGKSGNGGGGGFASGTFNVTPGQTLLLLVGGGGFVDTSGNGNMNLGGDNGGGDTYDSGSGGGFSAVYSDSVSPSNLLALAGGGGGGGLGSFGIGGNGGAGGAAGGSDGNQGGIGGGAGTGTQGGTGGTGNSTTGNDGLAFQGGGQGTDPSNEFTLGGGGGGGYFGGGQGGSQGGDNGASAGGGGGGSSYLFASATNTSLSAGNGATAGNVAGSAADYVPGAGAGGAGAIDNGTDIFNETLGASGSDGEVFLRYTIAGASSAPEPGALALFAAALPLAGGVALRHRRRRHAHNIGPFNDLTLTNANRRSYNRRTTFDQAFG